MLTAIKIAVRKVKRIPRDQLAKRLRLSLKKYVSDYPYSISIQTVSACNLKCKHCFINDYHTEIHDGVIKIMKLNEFRQFADRMRSMIEHASFFTFSTFEAILNKHLFEMMDLILEINPGMQFPFLSNTMELSAEKIARLEKYPVPEVNISLDGYTKKTVEDFKTEVVFEKIIEVIGLLRRSKLKDKLAVTFVAHQQNIHELPDYVDFVHGLGIRQIYVSNILSFTKNLQDLALYSPEGNPGAQQFFDEAIRRARANRVSISMPRLAPVSTGCQSTETFFVDSNGNVSPCDFLAVSTPFTLWGETVRHSPVVFGNILKDDPIVIYRNPSFKKFRRQHRLGQDLPEQCTHCIDAYGLMCSNRTHYTV
ncbi:MAG TPA: radical SAM protein [Puia sp.]|jgi:MoaA/NifB/PqqE/SkfB family radical SAM enzyme